MTLKGFLDTNIFLDHLFQRNRDSEQIIRLCEQKHFVGFASSASFNTLAYVIQERLKKEVHPVLRQFSKLIEMVPTSQEDIDQALDSNFEDIEDAFQYYTALNVKTLDYFITDNTKDYKTHFKLPFKLPIVSASDFVKITSSST